MTSQEPAGPQMRVEKVPAMITAGIRRTIAMRDGRIVYDGPSTALTNAFLSDLYGEASEELVLFDDPADAMPPGKTAMA